MCPGARLACESRVPGPVCVCVRARARPTMSRRGERHVDSNPSEGSPMPCSTKHNRIDALLQLFFLATLRFETLAFRKASNLKPRLFETDREADFRSGYGGGVSRCVGDPTNSLAQGSRGRRLRVRPPGAGRRGFRRGQVLTGEPARGPGEFPGRRVAPSPSSPAVELTKGGSQSLSMLLHMSLGRWVWRGGTPPLAGGLLVQVCGQDGCPARICVKPVSARVCAASRIKIIIL